MRTEGLDGLQDDKRIGDQALNMFRAAAVKVFLVAVETLRRPRTGAREWAGECAQA